jgi:hypothetical protein
MGIRSDGIWQNDAEQIDSNQNDINYGDAKLNVPYRRCTRVGSGLTRKRQTRLARLARDKRSSLLWKVVTYGRKKFYNLRSDANIIKLFKA